MVFMCKVAAGSCCRNLWCFGNGRCSKGSAETCQIVIVAPSRKVEVILEGRDGQLYRLESSNMMMTDSSRSDKWKGSLSCIGGRRT